MDVDSLSTVRVGAENAPSCISARSADAFSACGERVEVPPGGPIRCQGSLLATLISGQTAVPIAKNAAGEIVVTSASSTASFRLLVDFVAGCPGDPAAAFARHGNAAVAAAAATLAGSIDEAAVVLRLDAEYFLGSTADDGDFATFMGLAQTLVEQCGSSRGSLLRPSDAISFRTSAVRPAISAYSAPPPRLPPPVDAKLGVTVDLPVTQAVPTPMMANLSKKDRACLSQERASRRAHRPVAMPSAPPPATCWGSLTALGVPLEPLKSAAPARHTTAEAWRKAPKARATAAADPGAAAGGPVRAAPAPNVQMASVPPPPLASEAVALQQVPGGGDCKPAALPAGELQALTALPAWQSRFAGRAAHSATKLVSETGAF